MKLIENHKVEIRFNYYGDDNTPHEFKYIERIVSMNGEEIYRDKQNIKLYSLNNSPLFQFEQWIIGSLAPEQAKRGNDVSSNSRQRICTLHKFWLKVFGKFFKLKP